MNSQPTSDLERNPLPPSASTNPHEHHHQHERTYPEAELSNTAVVWDEEVREWRSQEEATERDSCATTVCRGDDQANAPSEKRLSVEGDAEKGTKGKESQIWVEWDGPNDPGNPFNVSLTVA